MVQYRDLNAPPSRMLADVVADMKAQERQSKTGDAGVKDLGETGDIIWPRWDGGEESVREVGENVEAARVSIAELNDVILPELSDELDAARTDLQQKLDAANARIDDIIVDGGGAGNFTTYSINEPTTAGAGEGDQWFRVVNGEVIGQWRWDGSVWQPVTLTDAIIAGIDLSKLVSNGNLSEVVANKMFADLFAANKITAQELAVGAVTAENIASGAIRADEIVGGSFTGETFEGGTFTGGLFKTSDALPGQVEFADDALSTNLDVTTGPGIRVVPGDATGFEYMPGIGPSTSGLMIYGGKRGDTGSSIVQCHPEAAFMRTYRKDGGEGGLMQTSPTDSRMRTYSGNSSEAGWVRARPQDAELAYVAHDNTYFSRIKTDANEAFLYTRAGGANRYLSVDANGVWVKTNKSGSWEWWNLEETANDTGWINFNAHSGISTGNSPALRLKGGIVWAQGYVTRPAGWPSGWTRIAGSFATWLRPTRDILRYGATTATQRQLVRMTSTGYLEVWWSAAAPGDYQVDLSVLSYPNS